ncbi:MAG TPA: helix-turn-helix domain-containing protein [Rhodopila sp.]|uniref:TetR/AcrR family transcriptional regulator n=1 Tax=Rhodopila sp. TaxID=2480087 RepID=UPI002BBADB19|nr:helix-turn-helix domain-containing protein [Rhodopila sp.]HVY15895.1 helix-turn-helix domain-containing protein [Rhodopila sp.]
MSDKPPMTERILNAANRLFYQKGIRAVGVDAIAAEAGISKRSLYDTFPSKEALVAAYLRRRMLPVPPSDDPPLQKVLSLFDSLHGRFASGSFRGCPFVNAVAEMAGESAAVEDIARHFKDDRREMVTTWLAQAGARNPQALGAHISLLIEGAYSTMLLYGDPAVALQAQEAARVLMRADGLNPPSAANEAA